LQNQGVRTFSSGTKAGKIKTGFVSSTPFSASQSTNLSTRRYAEFGLQNRARDAFQANSNNKIKTGFVSHLFLSISEGQREDRKTLGIWFAKSGLVGLPNQTGFVSSIPFFANPGGKSLL